LPIASCSAWFNSPCMLTSQQTRPSTSLIPSGAVTPAARMDHHYRTQPDSPDSSSPRNHRGESQQSPLVPADSPPPTWQPPPSANSR
jgi:hypothetical protein